MQPLIHECRCQTIEESSKILGGLRCGDKHVIHYY